MCFFYQIVLTISAIEKFNIKIGNSWVVKNVFPEK